MSGALERAYIGIDNGVTGSLACIDSAALFEATPSRKEQSYTKKKQTIRRIDVNRLSEILGGWRNRRDGAVRAFVERPFVNPQGFKASVSAVRALEATLIILESLGIGYEYIDSRGWQKALLPEGIKGAADLKRVSVDIGCRLFPEHERAIRKHGDADSLLIAEWARRAKM